MWVYKKINAKMIRIEKRIRYVFIIAFMLAALAQCFLFFYSDHVPLSRVAKLEGQVLEGDTVLWKPSAYIVLDAKLQGLSAGNLYVMINGKRMLPLFADREVRLSVHAGDVLEIDGSDCEGAALVTVKKVDDIIEQPEPGRQLMVAGCVELLGTVEFKN